jgi:hypothetical protein
MTALQLKQFMKKLSSGKKKEIVIRINTNNFKKGLQKSRNLLERLEREVRIQKLEGAVKKLRINRSWM